MIERKIDRYRPFADLEKLMFGWGLNGATVSVRQTSHIVKRATLTNYTRFPRISTLCDTAKMGAIEDAIDAIESREPGEDFTYRNIAKIFGVNRTTLARRHQGSQASQTVILTN